MRLLKFVRSSWTVIIPVLLIIVLTLRLHRAGYNNVVIFGDLGVAGVCYANAFYILSHFSRRRWPGLNRRQRFIKAISLQQ